MQGLHGPEVAPSREFVTPVLGDLFKLIPVPYQHNSSHQNTAAFLLELPTNNCCSADTNLLVPLTHFKP